MFQTPALQRYLMWNVPITHAAMRKPAPRGATTAPPDLVTLVTLNLTVLSIVHGARLDEHDAYTSSHPSSQTTHHRGVMPGVLTPLVASESAEAGRPTLRQLRAASTPLPAVGAIDTMTVKETVSMIAPAQDSAMAAEPVGEPIEEASMTNDDASLNTTADKPTPMAVKETVPMIAPAQDSAMAAEPVAEPVEEAAATSMAIDDAPLNTTTDEPTPMNDSTPLEESTAIESTMLAEPETTTTSTCSDDVTMSTTDELLLATSTLDATPSTPAAPTDDAAAASLLMVAAPALSSDSMDEPDDEEKIAAELPIISAVATPDDSISKDLVADQRSIAGSSTASEDGDDEADRVLSITVKASSAPVALPSPIPEAAENDASEPLFSMDLMSDLDDSDGWSVYASSECGTESGSVTDTGRSRSRSRIPRRVVQPELQPCLRRNNRSATSLSEHKAARLESPARARGDVTNRLYNPSYHQERDSKLEQLRAQRELEECTFRPSTNGKPRPPGGGATVTFLYPSAH
ncbi:hypothetical protein SPRG_22127 [Saprolegnia parasitica CBS 223.65]|uniref:Uncharacterized protein n=1 Tax=Saprolegnia parasitica (strain CBS 223.65) TaxID=695850 RepID=A0A067CK17_SAPPC|nr:hypothetical protein SPRG_22127 [Saprolegnia parasitica CBS 223.65]KDO31079.1 hypothetical protein SPRG_22127 [Saprolegnia parasitica CBS 223.65]|eukprot:XP_012198356.1 hypothetical protein SPRG_22127 [Saprolegnia parasitica CBS 223.65]